MYRAISPRTTWNDVNGEWMDMDEKVRKMKDTTKAMYGSDAYWGLQWNLNQFYNFLYPEYMSNWMNTFEEMYKAGGWLPIGNPGLEYYRVMIGAPCVPMIVSAYQHGVRDFDIKKLSEAIYHQQTANPEEYPGGGRVGNESYPDYIKRGYVPLYKDLYAFDSLNYQSYVSNTMEYAYQDYCAAQFFKALGEPGRYEQFIKRSENWRNTFDRQTGFTRPRNLDGTWYQPFDPHRAPAIARAAPGSLPGTFRKTSKGWWKR